MLTTGKPVSPREIGRVLFPRVLFLDAIFDLRAFRLLRITIFYIIGSSVVALCIMPSFFNLYHPLSPFSIPNSKIGYKQFTAMSLYRRVTYSVRRQGLD